MIIFNKKEIGEIRFKNIECENIKLGSKEIESTVKIPTELTVTPYENISIKQGDTVELTVNTNASDYNIEIVDSDADGIMITKKYSDKNTIVIIGKNTGVYNVKVSATLSDTKEVVVPITVEYQSETVLILDQIAVDLVPNTTKTVGADSNAESIAASADNSEVATTEVKKHVKI